MSGASTKPKVLYLWPGELQSLLRRLLDARSAGLLDDRRMTAIARSLVVGDGSGRLWTVGLLSGHFYRWDGSGWVEDEPRGRLLLALEESPTESLPEAAVPLPGRCPACGATVRAGARFCTGCGAEAPRS